MGKKRGKTTLQRAYELARSGECTNLYSLQSRLMQEGRLDAPRELLEQIFGLPRPHRDKAPPRRHEGAKRD